MAQPLYVLEAVDVRRADEPESSRDVTLSKLALPEIKRKTSGYAPGGGVGEVNFSFPQVDPIEPKFELKGLDPDMLRKMGFAAGLYDKWTFAGAVRNKQGGQVLSARAIIQGVVSAWTPDEFSVGEFFGCNYLLHEVTHYEFHLDGEELWYWDFYEREGRSGGVSWFSDIRTALGGG
ncbi:MAG: phage major tail tube protein [Beijerinckiaceae bacterium]